VIKLYIVVKKSSLHTTHVQADTKVKYAALPTS